MPDLLQDLSGLRPRGLPPFPILSSFLELNEAHEATIRERCRQHAAAFAKHYPRGRVVYAGKAYLSPAILAILKSGAAYLPLDPDYPAGRVEGMLDDADEYDTVGGLIYHRVGGVPKPGDQVTVDGLTLTVETTDGRRVGKVLVVRTRDEGVSDDEADR